MTFPKPLVAEQPLLDQLACATRFQRLTLPEVVKYELYLDWFKHKAFTKKANQHYLLTPDLKLVVRDMCTLVLAAEGRYGSDVYRVVRELKATRLIDEETQYAVLRLCTLKNEDA